MFVVLDIKSFTLIFRFSYIIKRTENSALHSKIEYSRFGGARKKLSFGCFLQHSAEEVSERLRRFAHEYFFVFLCIFSYESFEKLETKNVW